MQKLILAILAATVLVAGIFAFLPIQKASTVHTTIQGNAMSKIITVSGNAAPRQTNITPAAGGDATDATSCVKTSTSPFEVIAVILETTTDTNSNLDLAAFADGELSTNLADDPGVNITADVAVGTADDKFNYLSVNAVPGAQPIVGTTTVTFGPLADATAGDAADEVTVTFVLRVDGNTAATDFTCTRS